MPPSPRAAQTNAPPSEPAPARPPCSSECRGPGTRTPERKEGAPAAAPHLPRSARPRRPLATGRRRRVHPSSAHTHHLAKFKGAGRTGEGSPRREQSGGDKGRVRGGGENSKCYNFLPCPPPGLREGSARGAPMSSLSFSPPRSPPLLSRRPLQPPWLLRPGRSFRFSAGELQDGGGEGGERGKGPEASRALGQGAASRTLIV